MITTSTDDKGITKIQNAITAGIPNHVNIKPVNYILQRGTLEGKVKVPKKSSNRKGNVEKLYAMR
jgi:hypothetical protein